MSTMTLDAAGIATMRDVSPVKQATAPARRGCDTVRQVAAAPARAPRRASVFGAGLALAYECDGWRGWSGL